MKTTLHILCLSIALSVTTLAAQKPVHMSYGDFIEQLRTGTVSSVTFRSGREILVDFKTESNTYHYVVQESLRAFDRDPLLLEELSKAGIEPTHNTDNASTSALLVALLPSLIWSIVPVVTLVFAVMIYLKLNKLTKKQV